MADGGSGAAAAASRGGDGGGGGNSQTLFGRRDPVFRPWPVTDNSSVGQQQDQPANIGDFVRRLKSQGVEFRKLTDDGLRKEIEERRRKREQGENTDEEDEAGDEAADDGDKSSQKGKASGGDQQTMAVRGGPKSVEAMLAKRDEVLRTLESALQSGLIVVDFVSLLLSKDRPTQAVQTLSPVLREKVGIGTLSAGRIANAAQAARALQTKNSMGGASASELDETTRFNAQRLLEHKTECVGWQLLAMDRAAAMLAGGRKHLHAELRREETYWSEVVGVHDRGWGLSRMPGQRRVLRVKFGFSEAAPDLRAQGFAPLRRVKRGHVALDMSALGPPSVVVVTLRKQGHGSNQNNNNPTIIGSSAVPARLPAAAPLEDRILEARNTVYAQELWRELNREARQMVAHGVVCKDGGIVFPHGAHTEAVVRLQPLQLAASGPASSDSTHADTAKSELAETISASLHLFLTHGHRQHYRQRSVPSPPSDATGAPPPTYFLLRPLVANLKYEKAIQHTAQYLSDLCTILHGIGQVAARFTLFERPIASYLPPRPGAGAAAAAAAQHGGGGQLQSSSEGLATAFLAPREFTFELTIAPGVRLSIRSRTTVVPLKTQYLVQLLPPSPSENDSSDDPAKKKSPLQDVFPPADNYATLHDVFAYVGDVVAHVLAGHTRSLAQAREAKAQSGIQWLTAVNGMGVRRHNDLEYTIRFRVVPTGTVTEMDEQIAADEERSHVGGVAKTEGHEDGNDEDDVAATNDHSLKEQDAIRNADSPLKRPAAPELRLYASMPFDVESESAVHRRWTWSAATVQHQQASKRLQEILTECIAGDLKKIKAEEA